MRVGEIYEENAKPVLSEQSGTVDGGPWYQ
jgi:hypothetical protein